MESDVPPQELHERLREAHGSVVPVLLPGDLEAWLVVGYQEIQYVLRNTNQFSCDSRHWNAVKEGRLAPTNPLRPVTEYQPLIAFTDGQEHARLRSAVTDGLERFNRQGIRRYVTRYTHQLVGNFAATGRADLVADFAEPLPALVLGKQFGVPSKQAIPLGWAVRDMVRGTDSALESNRFITQIMRELVREKRARPGNDFASWLLAHESGLSDVEAEEHLRHAMVAAVENTVNLTANVLRVVLTDRRFRGNLAGGQMTLPDALDHVMWEAPPLTLIPNRWATEPVFLGGQHIQSGDMVMLALAAGNRDPQVRPDLSVPMHGNRAHLAFGAGPHQCPGQDIGRTIADTGIDTLLASLPDIELSVPEAELPIELSFISSPLGALPTTFRPRPTAQPGANQLRSPEPALRAAGHTPPPAPRRRSWWASLWGSRS
ncbi:cytochrome P450 [Streptomyces sp. NPDC093801]|uniref:cytochrome P450 n=1 Tax=Streptomyces sp. NPDC093801 TaxID=3155203 RepID=UPI00344F82D3